MGTTTSPSSLHSIVQIDSDRPKPHIDALFVITDLPRNSPTDPHSSVVFGHPNISTPHEITSLFSANALILTAAPDMKTSLDAFTDPSAISKDDYPTVIAVSSKKRHTWDMLWQHAGPDGPKLVYIARTDQPISSAAICQTLMDTDSAELRPEVVIALETSGDVRGHGRVDPDSLMATFRVMLLGSGKSAAEADTLLERVTVCGVSSSDNTLLGLALRLDDRYVVQPERARVGAVGQAGGSRS